MTRIIRLTIEVPILSGLANLREDEIAEEDRAEAAGATVELLHHKFGRRVDYLPFNVRSVGWVGEDGYLRRFDKTTERRIKEAGQR